MKIYNDAESNIVRTRAEVTAVPVKQSTRHNADGCVHENTETAVCAISLGKYNKTITIVLNSVRLYHMAHAVQQQQQMKYGGIVWTP